MDCKTCKIDKPSSDFGKDSRNRSGVKGECKACENSRLKAWRASNEEHYKAQARSIANEFYAANRERVRACQNAKRVKHPRVKHPEKATATTAWRRARLKQATPCWSDRDAILAIYRGAKWLATVTGMKYHVDHIVPLVNDIVCGLHVPANLQVMYFLDNHSKSNKAWPDMPDMEPVSPIIIDQSTLEPTQYSDGV